MLAFIYAELVVKDKSDVNPAKVQKLFDA